MAHPFHRGGYMHALRQLNLTAEQKQQIVAIRRANARALRRQIEAVLTPDQRAQLQASMPARRDATAVHAPSQ
jgi:Spy/CpxP family protein refolding chaperone